MTNVCQQSIPVISIGMPVFNGSAYLEKAIGTLLSQSYSDFELIISDNNSSDDTEVICRRLAAADNRIRYIRQKSNIGPALNFKFVVDQARGEYFMWSACDDIRSNDFLEVHLRFLSRNPDFVASTSPNGFSDKPLDLQQLIDFDLSGGKFSRFLVFFKNCWFSHAIFYALIRTKILQNCLVLGQSFIAVDWAVDLYLASQGRINRTTDGYTIFGVDGVSNGSNAYKYFRNDPIEIVFPFYRLAKYVFELSSEFSIAQRLRITFILLRLNIVADYHQLFAWSYSRYCKYLRPKLRGV